MVSGSFSLELWFILIDSAALISSNSHPLIALSFLTVCALLLSTGLLADKAQAPRVDQLLLLEVSAN